jgi:hypothetical protein
LVVVAETVLEKSYVEDFWTKEKPWPFIICSSVFSTLLSQLNAVQSMVAACEKALKLVSDCIFERYVVRFGFRIGYTFFCYLIILISVSTCLP